MNTLDRVQDIFREVFDDETIILTREMTADDIEEWDSLEQVNIIMACGQEFGIKFDINDIANIKSVGDIADAVERKLKL